MSRGNPKLQGIGPLDEGVTPRIPSLSFWGCGVEMRFFSRVTTDIYETTQWITLFGLPIVPLSTWVISPVTYEMSKLVPGLFTERFVVHGRRPFSAARLGRMYANAMGALVLCLGPLVASFLILPEPAPDGKDSPLALLLLVAVVWAFVAKIFIVDRIAVDPYDALRKEAARRHYSR